MLYEVITPLYAGDVMILCTDGVWGPLGSEELVKRLAAPKNLMKETPRVLDGAETLAGPHADNLSIVSLVWHDDFAEELPDTVSTQTMAISSFTTQMESFVV